MHFITTESEKLMESYDIVGEPSKDGKYSHQEIFEAVFEAIVLGGIMAANDKETRNYMLEYAADNDIKPSFYNYRELTV